MNKQQRSTLEHVARKILRKKNPDSPIKHANTDVNGDPADIDSIVASESKASHQSQGSWYNRSPWWKLLQAMGVVSAIILADLTYLQWRDLRHNFEFEQRAWLKTEYAVPKTITPDARVHVEVVNVGLGASPGDFEGGKEAREDRESNRRP